MLEGVRQALRGRVVHTPPPTLPVTVLVHSFVMIMCFAGIQRDTGPTKKKVHDTRAIVHASTIERKYLCTFVHYAIHTQTQGVAVTRTGGRRWHVMGGHRSCSAIAGES